MASSHSGPTHPPIPSAWTAVTVCVQELQDRTGQEPRWDATKGRSEVEKRIHGYLTTAANKTINEGLWKAAGRTHGELRTQLTKAVESFVGWAYDQSRSSVRHRHLT